MYQIPIPIGLPKSKTSRIRTALFGLAILMSLTNIGFAQSVSTFDHDARLNTHRMKITPAAEMSPKFRYRFSVPLHERVAGNAAMHYIRSFGEDQLNRTWKALQEQHGDEVHKWYGEQIPISELPIEKIRTAAAAFDSYVKHFIDQATRCRDCDWGLAEETLPGFEMVRLLIPEVQSTRNIARVLMLRARVAIADQRYDEAIEHLKMCYQLGLNVNKLNFLVADLVAAAEVGMANRALIELIGSPDSPNMYWALAELRSPLIDLRGSMQLEYNLVNRLFPQLKMIEHEEKTAEQWQAEVIKVIEVAMNLFSDISSSESSEQDNLTSSAVAYAMAVASYPAAKKRLTDSGLDSARLEKMPVGRVLLWDMKNEINRLSDHGESAIYLPFSKAVKSIETFEEDLGINSRRSLAYMLAGMLYPAIQQVRAAQVRVERQRNALMVIEAIRMHLAQVGSIPQSLDEITLVPIPLNPATDKSFIYSVNGDTMILELLESDGVNWAERFEIDVVEQ